MPSRLLVVVVAVAGLCNEASHDGKVVAYVENLIGERFTSDTECDKCASSHFIHHCKCDSVHLLGMNVYAEQI